MQSGRVVPPPVTANLLIDTGASNTVLDCPIIQQLGLQPTGTTLTHTPSTGKNPISVSTYDVELIVQGQIGRVVASQVFQNHPATEADFSAQPIDGLLGRDILSFSRMTYVGTDNVLFLSF